MKKLIFVLVLIIFSVPLLAQYSPCFEAKFAEGQKQFKAGKYKTAKKYFNEAKSCPDPNTVAANEWIGKCNTKIAEIEKKRLEEEEQRRLEEEERLAQEAEEERLREIERALAAKGYMDILDVSFVNVDGRGNPLPQEEMLLYDKELRYVLPVVRYNGLAEVNDTIALYVKMIGPDKRLLTTDASPEGFSYVVNSIIEPGTENDLPLKSWGSDKGGYYSTGQYRFELWYENNKLYSTSFSVLDTPPKELDVEISVNMDAEIFVDGQRMGVRSWRGKLIPGLYEIVCRKEGYRERHRTISIEEDSEEQHIFIDPLEPIFGLISVQSRPKSAQLLIDGTLKGETPLSVSQVIIGKHEIRVKKNGYFDYVDNVVVSENETVFRDVKLMKDRSGRNFATFFFDGVVGNFNRDEFLYGGHVALCPRHVGVYGQYLHGLYSNSYSAAGGVVFRMTKDIVDFQLFAGAGYGSICSQSNDYNKSFLMNFGGRLGWRSKIKWGMWDIMGGCSITPNGECYPYVGVGTGLSVIAAATAAVVWATGNLEFP